MDYIFLSRLVKNQLQVFIRQQIPFLQSLQRTPPMPPSNLILLDHIISGSNTHGLQVFIV